MTTSVDAPDATSTAGHTVMTHREVLNVMSGLLLAMFVAMLSSTIVSNALPRIMVDLGGNQSQYTWVIAATLLAATATTPIWGKLSDRMSKKLLVQLSISVFVVGSIAAGFSTSTEALIGFRALQGLGLGGLQALVQIVMAFMVSPRERGRYMGYFGAVMGVATVGGPLLGGFIVDASFLGWRWCFWVGAPIALAALILLQKTLHLPVVKAETKIDWWGALLIPGGVSVLLIWVTLAGKTFAWVSWTSAALVAASLVLIALALLVERRVPDPVVPPRLVRQRTMILAIVASVSVGTAIFGASVFFGPYFQVSRGFSPTRSGLLTVPLVLGLMVATTVAGRLVSKTGKWKRYLVAGTGLIVVGLALLGTIDHSTNLVLIGVYMTILGAGVGMSMQNLVLAAQNGLSYSDLGAGTSTITFFRSLGGAAGVSVLGAILAAHVTDLITKGLASIPGASEATQSGGSTSLDLSALPPEVRVIVQHAYGDATARIFLVAAVIALVAFVAVLFIKETALRTTVVAPDEDVTANVAGSRRNEPAT